MIRGSTSNNNGGDGFDDNSNSITSNVNNKNDDDQTVSSTTTGSNSSNSYYRTKNNDNDTMNNKYDVIPRWWEYYYQQLAFHPIYDIVYIIGLVLIECIVCIFIIQNVQYTEIDWKAYMEEVEMWYIDQQYDYRKIYGTTGPLVYPAGFLYLFVVLRYWTNSGTDIRTAQYIFFIFYILTQITVLLIYQQTITFVRQSYKHNIKNNNESNDNNDNNNNNNNNTKVQQQQQQQQYFCSVLWSFRIAMGITCLSKRIHSIYMLRLFNDGPTMLLLYLAIYQFNCNYWNTGCLLFSFAVSIKMNVLLYAPGLLLLLLQTSSNLYNGVIVRLLLCCAVPQLLLGGPFLLSYPVSYLRKAFELDRVFFYIWTVNWKFLPEDIFLSKKLSLLLLLCHLGCLGYFFCIRWRPTSTTRTLSTNSNSNNNNNNDLQRKNNMDNIIRTSKFLFLNKPLTPLYITTTMFVSNFIGICFARSIHYQFYCWYFHSIPYLLWYGVINNSNNHSLQSNTTGTSTTNPRTSTNSSSSGSSNTCYPVVLRLVLIVIIEISYLTFPATPISSLLLQIAHFAILFQIQPPYPIAVLTTTEDDDTNSSVAAAAAETSTDKVKHE